MYSKLLPARMNMRAGYWKLAQVIVIEMDNYRLDVLGISKTRWTHSDKLFLAERKKFIVYSGRQHDRHSFRSHTFNEQESREVTIVLGTSK